MRQREQAANSAWSETLACTDAPSRFSLANSSWPGARATTPSSIYGRTESEELINFFIAYPSSVR